MSPVDPAAPPSGPSPAGPTARAPSSRQTVASGVPGATTGGADAEVFCSPALVLRVVLALQAVGAAAVLLLAPAGGWWSAQATTAFGLLLATLAWLGTACAARRLLPANPWARQAALAVAGALCGLLGWAVPAWAGLAPGGLRAAAGAALAGALAALAVLTWVDQRARRVDPAQTRARLAELQSRIRPHFLFNALNAALALVRVDPDRAERVLEDLSVLFRQAMAETGSAVSLGEEIELARRYLDIEQVRFGDRLRVQWAIEPATTPARVPPLVLQPLVENAVKHGVEPALDGGDLQIRARLRAGCVELEVINSLPAVASAPGSGIALANVDERLRLLHDLAAHCEAGPQDGPDGPCFVARLTVPL